MNKRYIGVMAGYFMDRCGFEVFDIDAKNKKEADMFAQSVGYKNKEAFNYTSVVVLEIGKDEIVYPRRLTFKERWTGILNE